VACDVADGDSRRSLVSAATAEFGRIDILVNNAGIEVTAHFEDQDDEELDRIIRVNLIAPMQLTRLVLPGMLERKRGHIVNIASLAGKVPVPYSSPYAASKAGLIAFTEGLRAELQGTGVSASAICPGFVADAGMYADWERQTGTKASFLAGTVKPERVARDVVKAIRKNRPEMLQFWLPARPTAVLAELAPGTFEKIYPIFGVKNTYQKIADRRREEKRKAQQGAADGFGRRPRRLGVAEVAGAHRPEVFVEFVDERDAGGDVEFGDRVVADAVEVLDEGAEAVAMGADEDAAAGAEVGDDGVVPVGEHAGDDVLEALGRGEEVGREGGVAAVEAGVALIAGVERGRGDIVAAAPGEDLLGAVPLAGLLLVEALECAVVALVQAPVAADGDPVLVHDIEGDVDGLDGAAEEGSVGDIERETGVAHQFAGADGLGAAGFGEGDIVPAGEAVLEVPGGFAVAEEDEGVHGAFSPG